MMKNQNFESYYELGEKLAKEGDMEGAIACYHRVIALNPYSQSKCFLDDLEAINFLRINAKELGIIPGNNVEETSEGYLSLEGNQGFVFYGPYIDIPDGLYRVRVGFSFPENSLEMTEEQDCDRSFKFDVVSPCPYVLYEAKVDSHQTSLEFYLDFIEGHRTEFRFFSTGAAFSVSCIEMTLVYQPKPHTNAAFLYYFHLGCILQLKNKRQKANQAYSRAFEYSSIGTLIDGLITDEYALTLPPVAEEAYLSVGVLLEQQERWEEASACYRKVLEIIPNHASARYKLSIILAAQGQLDEAIACFQKAQKQPSQAEIYEKIWNGLNQLTPFHGTDIDSQAEIKLEDACTYFSQTSKYTVMKMVSLTDLNESQKTILEDANFSLANLELIKQDSLALEEIYINQFQEFKGINLAKKTLKQSNFTWDVIKPTNDFQQSIVETGYIYSVCPFTGRVLRSNNSFYLQHNPSVPILIYQFQSTEIFYLIVGTWSGCKIGIYFPRLDLVINFSNEWSMWLSSEKIINEFKAHAVSSWRSFQSYVSNEETKEVVAVVGNVSNLGHYFWNQISGLYYLYENDLLHKIDKFLIGANEYFELASLFPEIPPEKIVRLSDNNSFFRSILDNNYFAVQVTDSLIKEDLAARIQTAAVNKCSQSFLQTVEAAKKHFPLLWINLRSHNKAWISQVEGYANIITKIFDDYPDMAVVFDGFSTEKPYMEQIQALISPNVKVYNALECPLHETIVWAGTVDTYIAVIGSGLTLVTWIANKPGVAHSDRGHYSQLIFWFEVRENSVDPVLVPVGSIIDVTTGGGWENYDCDWKVIYDEVIEIVKDLDKSQEQPQLIENELTQNDLIQSQLEPVTNHQEYLKLDLGCGGNKKPGTIGLDYCYVPGVVDHVLNIQTDILPFPDRSVEYVHSSHTLEHLTDPIHLFQEVSRVCIDGAKLEFWTPYVWHNSAFIYGHTNYYQEDNYMHLCVLFPDFWSVSLGARWYLKEIVYVVPPHILVELYKQKIQLEFAIRYYKGIVQEFAAIIEVRHENKHQTIYPQRSFATSRLGERYLLPSPPEIFEQQELLEAINWFSASST
ncbi:tetratricopeptide repeat protein [Microcoleus sp. AT9b-C5]|uniref:tetratricopeptide repeat protein n=1 Tax=unclassified Microcoleus TaxID=2642155 RepID=UPI002FCF36A2